MAVIRQLPPNLINQIAAGEVIERPASVIKELMENSIDAGSRRIEVTISGGGSELIRISDDGCGMTADQLPLAVTSHATSKLPDDESLFHVTTLGFRGEALASIGSVSHLSIRSRTEGEQMGAELTVRGGVVESPAPCGCPVGTVIEVRNLFFNTPVRHRFLKTAQTERGHIVEAFTRLALANPNVHFVLISNDKVLYDLPPSPRWADRIDAFFGAEISQSLIPIESDESQIKIHGYVCDPSVSRGNNRMQYLFLNGRHIRDRALQHALTEAYRGLLMVGRHPVCFLRMDMPAELIDVNVHPTKLEVRFTDSGRVYSRLLQTLRHEFLTSNMTHRIGSHAPENPTENQLASSSHSAGTPDNADQRHRQEVIDWARTGRASSSTSTLNTPAASSQTSIPSTTVAPFQPFPDSGAGVPNRSSTHAPHHRADQPGHFDRVDGPASSGYPASSSHSEASKHPASSKHPAPWDVDTGSIQVDSHTDANRPTSNPDQDGPPSVSYLGFQVHNRYLVTQDESGMVVIDQHALHERVLYERVCAKVLGDESRLESQRLLVPEPVSLTPAERTAALDAKDAFAKIGLQINDFGGDTIVVESVPAILSRTSPSDMLRTLLEPVIAAGSQPDAKELLNRLLATIACKAAVKAGDRLTAEEITSLLEQKDLYHDTHHCPHGRPTALFFSRDELDRMFGRMGHRGRA